MSDDYSHVVVATNDSLNRFYVGRTPAGHFDKYQNRRDNSGDLTILDSFVLDNREDLGVFAVQYENEKKICDVDADAELGSVMRGVLERTAQKLNKVRLSKELIQIEKIVSVGEFDCFFD